MRAIGKRTYIGVSNVEDAIALAGMQRNRTEKRRARVLMRQIVRSPIYRRRTAAPAPTAADKINESAERVGKRIRIAAQEAGSKVAHGLRKFVKFFKPAGAK